MQDNAPQTPKVAFDLPLYEALWKLNSTIKRRFPTKDRLEAGLAALGIMFGKPTELSMVSFYCCTPTNVLPFASTGGDGVHFSFLVRDFHVGTDSPIVLTAPANSLDENRILAENFQTFLRLGIRRGFFGLEQFAYGPQQALEVYGNPDWQPTEDWHYSGGFVPSERQVKVLAFVAEKLNIQPFCYTPEEFSALQDRWMPALQKSQEYLDLFGD